MRHSAATIRRSRRDLGPALAFEYGKGGPAEDGKLHTFAYAHRRYGPGAYCQELRRRAQAIKIAEFGYTREHP